jgi:hypothetical protein
MPTVTQPAQRLISFELTQEETLQIAASLTSDIDSAADVMPDDFYSRHIHLYNLFMSKLTPEQKIRVINALPGEGAEK